MEDHSVNTVHSVACFTVAIDNNTTQHGIKRMTNKMLVITLWEERDRSQKSKNNEWTKKRCIKYIKVTLSN